MFVAGSGFFLPFFVLFSQYLAGRLIPFVITGSDYWAMGTPIDEVMDYRGLAEYMKLAEGTLRHWVMSREIPYFKIGRSVRFSKKQIDLWLEGHYREPKIQAKKSGDLFPAGGSAE